MPLVWSKLKKEKIILQVFYKDFTEVWGDTVDTGILDNAQKVELRTNPSSFSSIHFEQNP